MATLTILLTAFRDHIRETNWSGGEDSPSVEQIDAYFLKNMLESGNRRPKLVLRRSDDETLRSIIDGSTLPERSSLPIRDAYVQFRGLLEDTDPDLIYRGIARLIVIDVTLDRHTDDPQLVFESLNSTGVDLSEADMIKNFVLMSLPESEQTRMYEQYWSKIEALFRGSEQTLDVFVRDYMALRTKAPKQTRNDQIYRVFREQSGVFQKENGGLEHLLLDMLRYANYYKAFNPGGTSDGILEASLRKLRRLAPVAAILVSKLYRSQDELGSLTINELTLIHHQNCK